MSHFGVNKKDITKIMSSDLNDQQKDDILMEKYFHDGFKGGEEMRRKTWEWFVAKYPNQCSSFTCALFIKNEV